MSRSENAEARGDRVVTLLCSASGTGLSRIAEQVSQLDDTLVIDLEEILKRCYAAKPGQFRLNPGEPENMASICASNDRATVLTYWREASQEAIRRILSRKERRVVVVCHLTLFSPTRLEFYSPPVASFLMDLDRALDVGGSERSDPARSMPSHVARVVVLIDDIYDMSARLPSMDSGHEAYVGHVAKLTKPLRDLAEDLELSSAERQALEVELTVKKLIRLLHWRRSEMIAAELLTRQFNCRLTVLATKHEDAALNTLIENPKAPAVYVSHKITELRMDNLQRQGDLPSERWKRFVHQVNSISSSFLSDNVVAIQPTGIDELRFHRNSGSETRLGVYSGRLSDRWPVPNRAMYAEPNESAPHHFNAVTAGKQISDRYVQGLFGLLQQSIYDEIAYRDHLLVSCNHGLLIYRPTAIDPRLSGGVEEEVRHWGLSAGLGDSRPAIFIHVMDELIPFLDGIKRAYWTRWIYEHLKLQLRGLGDRDDIAEYIWEYLLKNGVFPDALPPNLSGHLYRTEGLGGKLADRCSAALREAINAAVNQAFKIPSDANAHVVHFVVRTENDTLSSSTMNRVTHIFNTRDSAEIIRADREMLERLLEATSLRTPEELALRFVAETSP